MPNSNPATANEFIEQELDRRIHRIGSVFGGHVISFNGPILDGVDDLLRNAVEKLAVSSNHHSNLTIVLTTAGGFIEVVQRMVSTVRRHYTLVDFVIPNSAYSAGTVFAMSGDAIWMDYYSRLGPIDPQIETQKGGRMVSALGHVEKYNALISKAQKGEITTAEVQLLIDGFDQAELYHYEQALELSIALLQEWLVKYKFKNWDRTETRQKLVSDKMKRQRAAEIESQLSNTRKWHSHGHGISIDVLRRDLNLRIDDFGEDADRRDSIRDYHELLSDYMAKRGTKGAIHIFEEFRSFM